MPVCCAAQAVPFHLFMDPIKEVGDQWTLNGDLGDFVGGFGNVDIPIWRGVDGVVALGLPEVPGVPQGPFLDRFLFIVKSGSCLAIRHRSVPPAI